MRKKLSSTTFLVFLVCMGLGSPSTAHAFWGIIASGGSSLSGFSLFKKWLGEFLLFISNSILGVAGNLLDFALARTVVGMSELVNGIGAIETGWIILRDLTNIFFIFVLLYAAISLILGTANFNTKTIVTRVVVVALLVNFSLFFTKAIVDVSNVVALEFYDNITITECLNEANADGEKCQQSGISTVFMDSMRLTSIYDSSSGEVTGPDNTLAIGFIGSIFILIATFVFFAGAVLFIIRFAVLVLLMMISPLALVAAILPKTKSYWKRWLDALLGQAFFAPMYLGITYIVALIVSDPGFKVMLYGGGSSFADELSGTWVTGTGSVILGFLIVSALLIATLTISKSMSVAGAATVVKWGNSAKRSALRTAGKSVGTPIGFAARQADELAGNTRLGNTWVGSKLRGVTTQKIQNVKFGAGSTYKSRYDKAQKDKKKRASAQADIHKEKIEKRTDKVAQGYQGKIDEHKQVIQAMSEKAEKAQTDDERQYYENRVQTEKDILEQTTEARNEAIKKDAEEYIKQYEKIWGTPIRMPFGEVHKQTADQLRSYVYKTSPEDVKDIKPWEEQKAVEVKDFKERRGQRQKEKKQKKQQGNREDKLLSAIKDFIKEEDKSDSNNKDNG